MPEVKTAAYGSWRSPITSDMIVSGTVTLRDIVLDGYDIYWTETRPEESGRITIVCRNFEGKIVECVPEPYNVRSRVHEYGGASYTVHNGDIIFANYSDQALYRIRPGQEAVRITEGTSFRYADFTLDRSRNRIICVRENHSNNNQEPVNEIVAVSLEPGAEQHVLVSGSDFYSTPRISPDDSLIAWLEWKHPNMPWDETELWVGELKMDGTLGQKACIAGGEKESIFQPQWSPDGALHFVSDKSGWWNLYSLTPEGPQPLFEIEAELGMPHWKFGMSTYAFESAERIVLAYSQQGNWTLATYDKNTKELRPEKCDYTDISSVQATPGLVVFCGASPTQAASIVEYDMVAFKYNTVKESSSVKIDKEYISVPEPIEFPTDEGRTAYGFYYAPINKDFNAPEGTLPPLIVHSHGGPTGATSSALNLSTQFWTSRGFAVLDVNYGGSTGYGRAYRERLNGQWGVVDVRDCVNGAKYLVDKGLADSEKLAISGGSAGGYTTLSALTFEDTFKAGASHYGISDLELLLKDTHKFESRYSDNLVGPYPESQDIYKQRSPIHAVDKLSCPVIFFQGLEDEVVPPNQAEAMVDALRKKGLPVAYLPFEGEQHGFRRAENIKRALDGELYFYSRVFGFELADTVEPVEIENLKN